VELRRRGWGWGLREHALQHFRVHAEGEAVQKLRPEETSRHLVGKGKEGRALVSLVLGQEGKQPRGRNIHGMMWRRFWFRLSLLFLSRFPLLLFLLQSWWGVLTAQILWFLLHFNLCCSLFLLSILFFIFHKVVLMTIFIILFYSRSR